MVSIENERLQEFIRELSGFAVEAEESLNKIANGESEAATEFTAFSQRMIAIRGTAQQLELTDIAHIAGLGEEISVKAAAATSAHQIRKCMSSLWDALTTVKYIIENPGKSDGEERQILVQRLESVLKSLGGRRPSVSEDEIAALLKKN
jgi:hypothetical protein